MLTRLVENFLFVGLATGLYIQNSLMIAGIFGYLIYSVIDTIYRLELEDYD